MPTSKEKAAFAKRLKLAMNRLPEKPKGGTALANLFNLRHHGEHPVSPQTAHKWLNGVTIPTPDKLRTMAEWFDVSLHWLHYGPSPAENVRGTPKPLARGDKYQPSPETLELASKIDALTPHHRYLVQEMITQFYGDHEEE